MAKPQTSNQTASVRESADDFDTRNYLKKDDYDADIEAIKVRLDHLETRVKDRAALATSIADTFDKDRNMDAVLIKVTKLHVLNDNEVKASIKKVVDDIDRDWLKSFMKRIGWAIGAIILALISGLAGYFIKG